ncbi:formylglycine-generating enzyme family protein [Nostoc sp. MG11]|uniref:formylglycine-generating enzyme family protein n=1 Tax=Nostoc sp. MG11 TaxID=2721166 RepID=UPI001867CC60|nr:formylglycine-generating enzyme family protein [Nostoc sp. MG11]
MFSIKVNDQYPFEFETVQVDEQGQVVERKQGRAFAFREPLADEIGLEMVAIPGGNFMMGSPDSEHERDEDESPQHQVTIQPFFMGKYPVTEAQWQSIANTLPVERELDPNPSGFQDDNLPVGSVTWEEAIEFCQRLSRETGRDYRLPTEAEWEYACRAGTETPFYFGKTITTDLANYRGTDAGNANEQWFFSGSYDRGPKGIYRDDITPVDAFPPNAFGLSDMHGNLLQWCLDLWHGNYEGAPADGSAWISKGDDNAVGRGGCCNSFPRRCRSASRHLRPPDIRYGDIGFRVVCEISRTL